MPQVAHFASALLEAAGAACADALEEPSRRNGNYGYGEDFFHTNRKGESYLAQPVPSAQKPASQGQHRLWWVEPALTLVVFGIFGLYSLWEVFTHNTGLYHNYLSPYFSPDIFGIRLLPAMYVAWVPLIFRFSCYYYRREYYRGFFWDPPACAIAETRKGYTGETKFPLNLNNLHRFALYLAIIVLIFLWKDAIQAFFFKNGFGVGLGSIIMLIDVILLSLYTFSCHAFRHLVGGRMDCFSCALKPRASYSLYQRITQWNSRHHVWAWASMFSVWGTDLYIRLLIMGVIHDPRFF